MISNHPLETGSGMSACDEELMQALFATVQFLKEHMGDWASQFTMQLFIDFDSDNAK